MRRLLPLLTCLTLLAGCGSPDKKPGKDAPAEADPAAKADDQVEPGEAKPGEAESEEAKSDEPAPGKAEALAPAEPTAALPERDKPALPKLPDKVLEAAADGYELILAGAEPLEKLRFSPTEGTKERVQLTMVMSMSVGGPGMPATTQKLPPIKQINSAETVSVEGDRITEKIVYETITVDSEGIDPAMAKAMQTAMQQIRGFEQTIVYDDRGGIVEGHLDIPEDTSEQLRQTFETLGKTIEQAMVRFPEEPVGVGGKWRETNEIDNGGLKLEQTTEFTLVAREGKRVTIETLITQKPLSTKFAPPNIPAELDIAEFDSKGAGRVVYDLDKLMPDSVDTSIDTKFTAEASAGGQRQKISFSMKIELEMVRVEDDQGAGAE